jgi:phosphoenolpyruvate synthase/pyruvate phosphate dikinase
MKSPTVRRLGDLRMADVGEVGGKAARLGELIAAGARVPDGLVLTLAAGELTAGDRRPLLGASAEELGSGHFAVRSSGIAEDGTERSFAGVYETVLDVPATSCRRRRIGSWQARRRPGLPAMDRLPVATWR